jgi:hypothetical protein
VNALVIAALIATPLLLLGLLVIGVVIGATRLNHRREGQS